MRKSRRNYESLVFITDAWYPIILSGNILDFSQYPLGMNYSQFVIL